MFHDYVHLFETRMKPYLDVKIHFGIIKALFYF